MPVLRLQHAHRWDLPAAEAVQVQLVLRGALRVEQALDLAALRCVGGVDAGFPAGGEIARAVVVVLAYPAMTLVEYAVAEVPVRFPYVPGLLSFREAPAILAALEKLSFLPDVLIFDGHGLAHPRRLGIACHLGVLLDHPTVGCAKSILVGKHGPLGEAAGSTSELCVGAEVLGAAVRTRRGVKPVYISPGHRSDIGSAVQLALACGRGYRLPEPTRLADKIASLRGSLDTYASFNRTPSL